MRHNQNGRRFRGRNNDGGQRHQGGGGGGGSNHSNHHSHGNNHSQGRRVNPRMQTFDSNGPDVRIRGTAYQINEKYVTLARDANSAGDRVLAESYLQHAEHYQRQINEMTEEYNKYNPPQFQQPQQPTITGEEPQPVIESTAPQHQPPQQQASHGNGSHGNNAESQPVDGLHDLDQGFLRGPRTTSGGQSGQQQDGNGNGNGNDADERRPHHQRSKEPQSV